MEDTIKESFINKAIKPVSIDSTEKILYQMKKCVFKININGIKGTGFFTKIPWKEEFIEVLITNNHIINKEDIENENVFTITFNNNEKEKRFIKINKKKICFTNKDLDITIIELTEKDEIYDFLELDEEIIHIIALNNKQIKYYYKNYINQSIYILNYLNGDKIMASYGLITDIKENQINHNCNTDQGSSGSPILSLENNKLIGVHYGTSSKFHFNKGKLIIYAIIELYKLISEAHSLSFHQKKQSLNKPCMTLNKKPILNPIYPKGFERIKNEIQFISNFPILNIGVNIQLPRDDENIFEWRGFFIGPDDTPYKGGIFYFKIEFPQNFGERGPEIILLTPIYHVNINHIGQQNCPLGHFSVSFLNFWYEKYKIREILIKSFYAIFYLGNPDSPFGPDRAEEMFNNPQLFEKKVKYFTKKYANINNASLIYKFWDFTYNIEDDKNNDYINITFELDGINRFSCQAKKNEITKNVVLNYFGNKYKNYYYKSKRLILNKTLEENEIDNNSLIIVLGNYMICG